MLSPLLAPLAPLAFLAFLAFQQDVPLTPGLVVTRSVVVRPGEYRLSPPAGDSVVLRVRGDDITLDLAGATLAGSDPDAPPDQAAGIGILIEGGRNITIRNARIRGYRIAVLAREVRGLSLLDNDLSHNWKPRLWSGLGHESLVDWLSFHQNDKEEWLRFGAAAYLTDVTGGEIRGNVARQGMNGLLLVRSDSLRIWNNDFSYLSGLGIGLYRSSRNTIMHNRLDWCIRGYVHGVYQRGQDSAALLLYEQSSDNVVAYNTMTHSGDGVFLWAGQSTMDSGQGGANDNLFFGNDVSFAAANGIEVTFSRNRLIGNRIEGSTYGVWGGYSWETEIRDNRFLRNTTGLAIEHGQENRIAGNRFENDRTAVRLWQNRIEPSDWGYPKHRDTRSRDYHIEGNAFVGNRVALRIDNTTGVVLQDNSVSQVDTVMAVNGDTSGWVVQQPVASSQQPVASSQPPAPWRPDLTDSAAPRPLPGGWEPFLPPDTRQGRETIIVDQWGPYDWRSPRLWPASVGDSAYAGGPLRLRVLGPAGRWRLAGSRGIAELTDSAGSVGDTITVRPAPGALTDWEITLEYRGVAVTAPTGRITPAGQPFRFSWSAFRAPIDWTVTVVAWDSTSDPRIAGSGFRAALDGPALRTLPLMRLDWMWYRPRIEGIPAERFAVAAEGTVELPPREGGYELIAISDDGIRIWVDDRLVIDQWEPHESRVARAPVAPGRHRIRVEYFQVGGWTELRVEVIPRTASRDSLTP